MRRGTAIAAPCPFTEACFRFRGRPAKAGDNSIVVPPPARACRPRPGLRVGDWRPRVVAQLRQRIDAAATWLALTPTFHEAGRCRGIDIAHAATSVARRSRRDHMVHPPDFLQPKPRPDNTLPERAPNP